MTVITQNVDDLHERGGSSNVLHLHGELTKARSSAYPDLIYDIGYNDINPGDTWIAVPSFGPISSGSVKKSRCWMRLQIVVRTADQLLIVGTSLQVYPAAGLVYEVDIDVPITVIDAGRTSLG